MNFCWAHDCSIFLPFCFSDTQGSLWPPWEAFCAELFLDSFLYGNSCQLNDAGLLSSAYIYILQGRKKLLFLQVLQSLLNRFYPYLRSYMVVQKLKAQINVIIPFKNNRDYKRLYGNIIQQYTLHTHISKITEIRTSWDFPGGSVVKNPPANAGDTDSRPGLGRSHIPQNN